MLRILTLCLSLILPGWAATAQDGPAIEGVISDQMEAFRADDFATAFTFASPGIRSMFGTPERFGAMVTSGYPMVHRTAEVTFLDLREVGGRWWQKVLIRDGSGTFHTLDYQMVRTKNGWQINGVRILQAAQVGA